MDKAVILARGLGTRMRKEDSGLNLGPEEKRMAAAGIKALMPVGRPFLDYVLGSLADSGYRRVCLVIGPEHDELRRYYSRTVALERLQIDFAVQQEPRGTADAVAAAERFVDGSSFLAVNSDNYYPVEALEALRQLSGPGLAVFDRGSMVELSNISEDRLAKFALAHIDPGGCLSRIREKPEPESLNLSSGANWVSMNCWRFDPEIFSACAAVSPSPRGELEITDAVQYCIDEIGQRFRALCFAAPVLDLSSREDIAPIKEHLAGQRVRL